MATPGAGDQLTLMVEGRQLHEGVAQRLHRATLPHEGRQDLRARAATRARWAIVARLPGPEISGFDC